jgi:hypothetical protein
VSGAKKKKIKEQGPTTVAELMGTISRVYGILRLECEDGSMAGRWQAVEDWCKEKESEKSRKDTHGSLGL